MTPAPIGQQAHGYRNGHQLLAGNVKLAREDQDIVDRLSDMAGPLRPGETFPPYLTSYPLPSGAYHVLARTWQDREAPRAGCVLTRSLMIPVPEWRRLEGLNPYLALLAPVERGAELSPLASAPTETGLPPVKDPRTGELVEALFLETRQSTVVFDAPEAELILHRLLVALWPAMRSSFAACTFALAPRKLGGREFDLMFAPKSARNRFADWTGRRIEATAAAAPRHRWTLATAERIFRSSKPNLTGLDALGAMNDDDRGDGAALRLSLLWNELAAKADESPNAVLGMLDILSSQPQLRAPASLLALSISKALRKVSRGPDTLEGWRFISTLIGKFPDAAPSRRIRRELRGSVVELTRRDPGTALDYLVAEGAAGRDPPPLLLSAVGDGLAAAPTKAGVAAQFERLEPETALGLLAFSRVATRWLGGRIRGGDEEASRALTHALSLREVHLIARVRRALTPLLDHPQFASAIPPLVRGIGPLELESLVASVGKRSAFSVEAFDQPLAAAATTTEALLALRKGVLAIPPGPGADRFLLSTLRVERTDIEWLCAAPLSEPRRRALATRLIAQTDDRQLQSGLRDTRVRDLVIELLRPDDPESAVQLARILEMASLPAGRHFELGRALLHHLPGEAAHSLALSLLDSALASAPPEDPTVRELLPRLGPALDPRRLVRMLTPPGASSARIAANLVAVESARNLRAAVVDRVDELTSRLVSRGREDLGQEAYLAWARLIESAQKRPEAYLSAAAEALQYALRRPDCQASALIVVSFAPVYVHLPKGRGMPDFMTLMILPLTLFTGGVDQSKSARHELVDAFLRSVWPPANLVLSGVGAGIEQKLLKRVSKSNRGKAYLAAIAKDTSRLPPRERGMVRDALAHFRESGTSDWDD